MNKRGSIIWGSILILLGVLFLLNNMNIFKIYFNISDIGFIFSTFWPLFLIAVGTLFQLMFFTGQTKDAGILVPGGMLLTAGLTCQLATSFGLWGTLWPGFILAVAVGLFELYLFGTRDKGLLIPVGILGGLSLIFFSSTLQWTLGFNLKQVLIPIILILIGVAVFLRGLPAKK